MDHPILFVGEPAFGTQADVFDGHFLGADAHLMRTVAQVAHGGAVLQRIAHRRKMHLRADRAIHGQRAQGFAQQVLDQVVLIGPLGQRAAGDLLFQPQPLEVGRFVERCRGVVIEFVQLGRAIARIRQIHAAIQMRVARFPGVGDPLPVERRDGQPGHQRFRAHHLVHQLHRHVVQLLRGRFDVVFDLTQRKRVVGAFVPIRLAVDGVEVEAQRFGLRAPIRAFGDQDALHVSRRSPSCGRRCRTNCARPRWNRSPNATR